MELPVGSHSQDMGTSPRQSGALVFPAATVAFWEGALSLHGVRRVAEVLLRRFSLGLSLLATEHDVVRGVSCESLAARHPLCRLLRATSSGPAGCARIGQAVAEAAAKGSEAAGAVAFRCPAGLRGLAVPVRVGGANAALVFTCGFLGGEAALATADGDALVEQAARLGIPAAAIREVGREQPHLTAVAEEYVGDLLWLAAREVACLVEESPLPATGTAVAAPPTRYCYDSIIGQSRPMQELYRLLDKVIGSDSTVLIQGENGTGKELFAKAIHGNSPRQQRRFVVQNCSAFNDNLLDSELFGHKRGSFTGAVSDKRGLFEVADGGTFFLDEIGDMSPALQVKLLRVLQEGTFLPVGDTQPRTVDVRIIAATNRDLKRMVDRGEFREDLYYRIHVIALTVPPLRERRDDIPVLVDFFLRRQAKGKRPAVKRLTRGCLDRLLEYDWPGNVRELENEIERLVVLAGDDRVVGEDLLSPRMRQAIAPAPEQSGPERRSLPAAVRDLERNLIYQALRRNRWNKTLAAKELCISRRNLIRKVSRYKLEPRPNKAAD